MKKHIVTGMLIAFFLYLHLAVYAEESFIVNESFENGFSYSVVSNEKSSVTTENVYGLDGTATHAVNLKGTGAYFDILSESDMADTIIEFDFLPQNITEDGFVFMSLVPKDSLGALSLLALADETLAFSGESINDSLHIDWYRIKILITAKGMQIFVNNEKKSDVISLPTDFDITSAGVRFEVSGENGNNSIYIDNVSVSKIESEKISVSYCPFERYNCEIQEILPGRIKVGFTVFSSMKESETIAISLSAGLFRNGKLYSIVSLPAVTLKGGENTTVSGYINVPSDNEDYVIKVFGWNDKMQPYIASDILK